MKILEHNQHDCETCFVYKNTFSKSSAFHFCSRRVDVQVCLTHTKHKILFMLGGNTDRQYVVEQYISISCEFPEIMLLLIVKHGIFVVVEPIQ